MTQQRNSNIQKKPRMLIPDNRNESVVIYEKINSNSDNPVSYENLMAVKFPPVAWVIDRLIPNGLTILSAQPGSFKTWLLLDIAIAVSQGGKFLDGYQATSSGVLIVDEENSPSMIQTRLRMLGEHSTLNIQFFIEQGFKLTDETVNKIINTCHINDIGLVTFDSLVRLHDKNENDATQMAEVFNQLRKITKADINVLITHHNRKSGGDDNPSQAMRGSSDILASVDCHLALRRIPNSTLLTLSQTKIRIAPEIDPLDIDVEFDEDSMSFTQIENQMSKLSLQTTIADAVVDVLSNGVALNQKQISQSLSNRDMTNGIKALRAVLNSLVNRDTLIANRGKGKEILYKLRTDESSEIIES